jgi:predicted lipoprotein with Yx(FWY)xxD motif
MKALIIAAATLAAVLALAACGGSNGSDSSSASPPSSGGTSTVSVEDVGSSGQVLVDSSGMPLYAADQESGGMVLCTGGCVSFWKPLTASAAPSASSLPGTLGVTNRPDGTKQVTYNGDPLYTFVQDQPGEVTGDGFADAFGGQHFTWHVVHPDGTHSSTSSSGSNSGGLYGNSSGAYG